MVEGGTVRLKEGWKDPLHLSTWPPPRPTPVSRTKRLALATLATSSLPQFLPDRGDPRQLLGKHLLQLAQLRAVEIQAGGEGWPLKLLQYLEFMWLL